MSQIKDSSILISGGGSGIGKGVAIYLASQGAKVTICGRRQEKLKAVSDQIGSNCVFAQADITSKEGRLKAISAALEHGKGLDALLNIAGNMYRKNLEDLEEDKLIEIFHSNVIAGMMLSKESIQYLRESSGSIVFVSSVHTRRAFTGASPYAASKGALETLTKVLASELGPSGVRVNCIVPGAVPGEINQRAGLFSDKEAKIRLEKLIPEHRLGRIGTPKEIAKAIEYLITADWTTGAILDVDGGLGLGAIQD